MILYINGICFDPATYKTFFGSLMYSKNVAHISNKNIQIY
jgi:hypothetical protein